MHQTVRSRRDAGDRDRGVDGREPRLHEAHAEGAERSRATTSSRSSRACSSTSVPRRSSWTSATPCTTAGTASSISTIAVRYWISSRWARTMSAACATTSRTRPSMPPRWPPTAETQIRPIHRPPRAPADRHPHCAWTVTIDESYPEIADHPVIDVTAPNPCRQNRTRSDRRRTTRGKSDYSGELVSDVDFARSHTRPWCASPTRCACRCIC